jgi:hypothetical protein
MVEKPRSRFQFRLRTLLIGVTVFCLAVGSYVAHEGKIVRDRKSELNRGQEGLPAEATIAAYQTIYFAAQRTHFARDNPKAAGDIHVVNDPRLLATEVAS